MLDNDLFPRSELLIQNVIEIIDRPLFDASTRVVVSGRLCHIAIEHAAAFRTLAEDRHFASALVVFRAQFEATLRAVWALYAATDQQIERLDAPLTPETEQAAKNLPQPQEMLAALERVPQAQIPFAALTEFKANAWPALNSYVHGGIHPLSRVTQGYPPELVVSTVRVSNALALVAAMQFCVLTGIPGLQKELTPLHQRFKDCLPIRSA